MGMESDTGGSIFSGTGGNCGVIGTGPLCHLQFVTGNVVRMTILGAGNSGYVGIGVPSPNYQLQLSGSAGKPGGGSWTDSSDVRLKTDVMPITNALDLLTKIQGVHFRWINPKEHENRTGVQGGFIAQDIEKTFPGWIMEVNPSGSDAKLLSSGEKVKSLTLPFEFDALVVESIKELKKENDELKKENDLQRKDIDTLKEEIKSLKGISH